MATSNLLGINSSDIGITTSKAKYPQYGSYTSRLSTFHNVRNISQAQESLARAGFFSTGVSDLVRCFYCGGGLRNWERNDDPWTEHRRWFPKCDFLSNFSNKDDNMEDLVRSKYERSLQLPVYVGANNEECTNTSVAPIIENLEFIIAAKAVLSLGYNKQEVANAFEHCHNKNRIHVTAQQLLGKLFELRSTEESLDENVEKSNSFLELENENVALKERLNCTVCQESPSEVAFLPCGHLVTCLECAPAIRFCPNCQLLVKATVKVYLA